MNAGKVYLIPTVLHEDATAFAVLPAYLLEAIKECSALFVENLKTARRFLKRIDPAIQIDDFQWFTIHKAEDAVKAAFLQELRQGKTIGILSEAGCPGIADPGQQLVEAAQALGCTVKPFVGPSSLLLALMASGMNGQHFRFRGYLPIEVTERKKSLKLLETEALRTNCTQLFIETPYRNQSLLKDILQTCQDSTRLCIAVDITSAEESIKKTELFAEHGHLISTENKS